MVCEALEGRAEPRVRAKPQWYVGISIYNTRRNHSDAASMQAAIRIPRDLARRLTESRDDIANGAERWQLRGTAADGLEVLAGRSGVKSYGRPDATTLKVVPSHFGLRAETTSTVNYPVRLEQRGSILVAVIGKIPELIGPRIVERTPAWQRKAAAEYRELVARAGPPEPRPDDGEEDDEEIGAPESPQTIPPEPAPPPSEPTITRLPPRPAAAPRATGSDRPDRFNPALPPHIIFPKNDAPDPKRVEPWRARMRQWEEEEARRNNPVGPRPAPNGANGYAKPKLVATVATPPALHSPAKYTQPIDESVRSEILAAIEMLNAAMDRDKSGVVVLRLYKNRVCAKRAAITLTDL